MIWLAWVGVVFFCIAMAYLCEDKDVFIKRMASTITMGLMLIFLVACVAVIGGWHYKKEPQKLECVK